MKIIPVFVFVSLSAAFAQSVQPAVVRGAPYSADRVQQRADSAKSSVIGHIFRDSEGRTREEDELITGGWHTEILDPIAGVAYSLDDAKKVAYRRRTPVTTRISTPPHETIENLGTQVIEGILSKGTRRTSDVVIDTWYSAELKLTMMTSGNGYTTRLVNLRRIDPDPTLFRPPGDYVVVDQ